jgi:thioredoxin-dependent peroxiredoxin
VVGIDEDAPGIVLVTNDGQVFDLGAPSQRLVIFFYEEAMSARSVGMAGDFNDQLYGFRELGVHVIGVGIDRPAQTDGFATSYDLHFPLVSDPDRRACLAFGVVGSKSGRPRATTFMIDTTGLVKRVFADVPPYGHAKDVLAEAEAMWGGY